MSNEIHIVDSTEASGESAQFVTMMVADQLFGIRDSSVHDVLAPQKVTPIPLAPRQVAGVTLTPRWREVSKGVYRLDDQLLVVLDVERLLDFGRAAAA